VDVVDVHLVLRVAGLLAERDLAREAVLAFPDDDDGDVGHQGYRGRDVDTHRGRRDDLVDVVEFGLPDDPDDDLPQQLGFQHRDAVADGVDEVVVAVLLDDGRVEQGLLEPIHAGSTRGVTKR
jgi:hypothetical protein